MGPWPFCSTVPLLILFKLVVLPASYCCTLMHVLLRLFLDLYYVHLTWWGSRTHQHISSIRVDTIARFVLKSARQRLRYLKIILCKPCRWNTCTFSITICKGSTFRGRWEKVKISLAPALRHYQAVVESRWGFRRLASSYIVHISVIVCVPGTEFYPSYQLNTLNLYDAAKRM